MDKQQAYYSLWSSFGLPAYDETSVPDDAKMPYITYQVILDSLDAPVYPTASLWYRDTSWNDIDYKLTGIAAYIEDMKPIPLDEGYMYVTKGSPFAQRMAEEDRTVKRYVINLGVEFLTKY
jgi:hypothetical protein